MIQAKFGLPGIALRTLEVYTTATLEATLAAPAPVAPEWRAAMERLSSNARDAFRRTVYDDPRFIEYFRTATPEAELDAMHIGSRPARRQQQDALQALRAIPTAQCSDGSEPRGFGSSASPGFHPPIDASHPTRYL